MRFIILNMLYDCTQVLLRKRKHPIKDDYFSTHILFTTIIYLKSRN
jgi:hypothetical protein